MVSAQSPGGRVQPAAPQRHLGDMAPLVRRLRAYLAERGDRVEERWVGDFDRQGFARTTGFAPRRHGKAEIVLAAEVAVELGHPSDASQSVVLLTAEPGLVEAGWIRWVGPDFDALEQAERRSFAQVVLVELAPGELPDPFELDSAQYLTNRLPGYMVRSVPGRLWARVSRRGRQQELGLQTIGQALIAAYVDDFSEVRGAEVVFVTASRAEVEALAPIAHEARILSGQHKKLALGADGEVECADLDCESCDERPLCDSLRDVVIQRRNMRRKARRNP